MTSTVNFVNIGSSHGASTKALAVYAVQYSVEKKTQRKTKKTKKKRVGGVLDEFMRTFFAWNNFMYLTSSEMTSLPSEAL